MSFADRIATCLGYVVGILFLPVLLASVGYGAWAAITWISGPTDEELHQAEMTRERLDCIERHSETHQWLANIQACVPRKSDHAGDETSAQVPEFRVTVQNRKMAQLIRSHRLWCGSVREITPALFGKNPNQSQYHVLCDDGRQAVSYTVTIHMSGGYVTVE